MADKILEHSHPQTIAAVSTCTSQARQKQKLFFTKTYNFEGSSGEEFLIRLWDFSAPDATIPVHRLVFLSGTEPHIPIYRSRLHYDAATKMVHLSHLTHPGSRIEYTKYNDSVSAVTRIARGTFQDASHRGASMKTELTNDLSEFGLQIVEKEKKKDNKEPRASKRTDLLPKTGVIVRSSTPNTSAVLAEHNGENSVPSTSQAPTDTGALFDYFNESLKSALAPSVKANPMSVDPGEEIYTLISSQPKDILRIINEDLAPESRERLKEHKYIFEVQKSNDIVRIIVFEDATLAKFALYEGVFPLRILTCAHSRLRFALRYS